MDKELIEIIKKLETEISAKDTVIDTYRQLVEKQYELIKSYKKQ